MPLTKTFYTVRVASAPLPVLYLNALRQIEVETSLERAAVLRLHFDLRLTPLGDWDVLQADIFRPLVPIQIKIAAGMGLSETLINGYVKDTQVNNQGEPGRSTLDVVGMDATSTIMNLHEKSVSWPNLSDSGIAMAIFGQHGMVPAVSPTPSTRTINDTTTIQRMTDIRFLKQLARRNGFECYVQPDPLIGMDMGCFRAPQTLLPPQGVLSVDFGLATNMSNFSVRYDMLQPTAATSVGMDASTKTPQPGIAMAALEPPMGLEPALGRIFPPPMVRPADTGAANMAELLATSQSIADRSSRCIRGSGTVDGLKFGRVLRPGLPVLVRGPGRQHSGNYYVTQVTHTISVDGYTQRFDSWRNAVGLTGAEVFVDPMAAVV